MQSKLLRAALLLVLLWLSGAPHGAFAAPAITAESVLAYTNAERYQAGLPLYSINAQLSSMAATKMADMFARQYFAHEAPTGETVGDLAQAASYAYLSVGENLALGGFSSSRSVVDAWMDSPGHKKNILHAAFTEIGIAAGQGVYNGRTAWIVVQEFGLPRTACPAPNVQLREKVLAEDRILSYLRTVVDMRKKIVDATPRTSSKIEARVAEVNTAVKLHNDKVSTYRALVKKYNATVTQFNDCVDQKLARS